MDAKLLKSKMVLCGDEDFVSAISKLLEISRQTASSKLHCKTKFTQTEIATISRHYGLTAEDIKNIFVGEDNDDEKSS